jgi:fructoselysine-6-P-deglycase FrlB-like protein
MMLNENPGLALMQIEMSRQRKDALLTFEAVAPVARVIAERIRACGRLVVYGIGGSHHINRIAETLYLDAGIDACAIVASQALLSPLPAGPRVALFTSQSGSSGEIIDLLSQRAGLEERFGITLEPDSPLAQQTRGSLVAVGGTERAFAATRSIILSIAMHGAILEALGVSQHAARDVLRSDTVQDSMRISEQLRDCSALVFSGRHVMRGVAQSEALSMMELARIATIAFEGGQLRHGPLEFLHAGLGVVLLRSAGAASAGIDELASAASQAGCRTVIIDSSGLDPVSDGLTYTLPRAEGLAAALQTLLLLQDVNIDAARYLIPRGAGTALRTSKITA